VPVQNVRAELHAVQTSTFLPTVPGISPENLLKCAPMRTRIYSNGTEISANPFVERFVGSVCSAIAASLKASRAEQSVSIELEGEQIRLQVDSTPLELDRNQGFAATLVRDTIRGMIRQLKGIDALAAVRIDIELN
jgi:hypothetical protein